MRYRLISITFLTGLLITGCGGGSGGDYDTKLAQYENCLSSRSSEYLAQQQNATDFTFFNSISPGGEYHNGETDSFMTVDEFSQYLCAQYQP
jgi:hypothetical protein